MRTLRQTSFAICAAISFAATPAAAFQPRVPSLQTLHGYPPPTGDVVQLYHGDSLVTPPQRHQQCRISGARAQRIERNTSNPCLAADSVPGAICFERLGQSTPAYPPALLNSWDSPC
jgi:hypothetical protein